MLTKAGSNGSLENDSPSRGRKQIISHHNNSPSPRLENDSPSRGRKRTRLEVS